MTWMDDPICRRSGIVYNSGCLIWTMDEECRGGKLLALPNHPENVKGVSFFMSYAPQMPSFAASMPPDIYQSAIAYQLGQQPNAEYGVTTGKKRVIAGIFYFICGIVLGGIGLIGMSQQTDSSDTPIMIFLVVLGIAAIIAGIYTLLYGTIYKNWHVYVFEQGFLFKKGNEAPQPFRWDQIEAVWYHVTRHYRNGIYTGTTHNYRVRRKDGYQIVLNDRFTNVEKLGDTISNQVTKILLPQVIAAYNAGQTITFGPLSVNRQGLTNVLGNLLPWPEIKDIEIQRGFVAVSRAGKWLKWSNQSVKDIPNVFVFIALVKALLRK